MRRFTNANIFLNGRFTPAAFDVEKGRFQNIHPASSQLSCPAPLTQETEIIDLQGAFVIPGLIDIHGHGNSGYDFSTCGYEGLVTMARYLGTHGITSFAPASMTMSCDALAAAYQNAKKLHAYQLQKECSDGCPENTDIMSRLAGINMEGPFFSYGKRGAQDPSWLKAPDEEMFRKLMDVSGGLIRLVDVAPELKGAMTFIRNISRSFPEVTVSVAHTEAGYETVCEAFQNGAAHMTHLFNGMNGIHHRAPGPVCAAYDTPGVFVELICDGIHIHPSVIRMVFSLFPGRVILISDALACCGMPDGRFTLGDQEVTLKDHHATLADGTLAGSASNLFDMLRNVVSFGIPLEEAVISATLNPARQLHLDHQIGSIGDGKKADFLICSESLQLLQVYIGGSPVPA